ncbi:MAG: restriction endonuclease subunit S [Microcystis panniformis Mp_MB_F_20051200_S9]|uniref:Restriction endonuclease subunit S n=1 Tax=Microcystis panniformis Mp_MB_F_20051200_S9 TaxID=2486223 RepID=A0A552Q0Z2_9CHRO|nr:MAG: restriction endonuclease subunit S [Microcystis panniformis Mp_GB_SS_20050300_S99]TRV46877.1 MAG: restriction endonuclease subunit S [Microcystis panniformis Mp_GB_SS_20050300_S99D]TRV52393.1 MAG: restriction endonuclease subunit S [Microcystis panniformis Mp_MB_F_20080800_S26D]TRV61825.1 MAG: restriction endonuclease subunit S [Microcystis panniformis Mp_MB_F_20080800_S26]TRV62882.1 MAG: restriction endonuclease subunit S [Microcystis panniformis Mp_MB_F_20051200_S9]TRV64577.1 MAG: re
MTDSNSNYSDLPQGWKWVELENVVDILDKHRKPINSTERQSRIEGKTPNQLYPYYGATGQVGYIDNYLLDGDFLLLGEDGAPFFEPFKNVAYLVHGKIWVNNHAHVLKAHVSNAYLCYFLNQVDYHNYVTGTTRLKLNQSSMRKIRIKLPPPSEQHRIVEKIEELFSELDSGVASLKKALEQLKTYRQAVLKWAFEGKLTEKWRNAHQDTLEDADTLLQQIKAERERHYQQQLEDWKQALKDWETNGQETKKPTAPRKQEYYSPLKQEETNKLWKIPDKWTWEKVGNICQSIVPNRDKPKSFSGNIPWITTPDIDSDLITLKLLPNHLGLNINEVELYNARVIPKNSVIMTCVGSFGIVCINTISCVINQQLHAFMIHSYINNKYLAYALKIQQSWMDKKSTSTTVVYLNKTNSNSIPIPLSSLQEQTQIVQEIESRLSICDKLEATLTENLDKAEALRQSILKRAFEGKLVL